MRARPVRAAAAPLAALTLTLGLLGPAAAATAVEIRPAQLERGEDIAVPHVEGSTIVDGDLRIDVGTPYVGLLGTSGEDYVVLASGSEQWRGARALRVRPDGTTTVLVRRAPLGRVHLSEDGATLALARRAGDGGSRLQVFDTTSGERRAERRVRGYADVLDTDGGQVLVSSWRPRKTYLWRTGPDRLRRVLGKAAYAGDLGLDRVAWFGRDPYSGGCSIVAQVTDPEQRVWRSCRDAVESWSPDGTRMLTMHKLTDGVGPSEVSLREADGARLARFTVDGWFSSLAWEDGETVLLGANAHRRFATVRCDGETCERASDLEPAHPARVG
ncbi:hypothetical protein [Nocardioides ferulae]|uniref:hypothetical protein n=1 Tax=Nocardioides ferulae TaxID=2340821 RepID=UPI000EAF057E|nr:hypothetical protein [Nocardioides ferulae]